MENLQIQVGVMETIILFIKTTTKGSTYTDLQTYTAKQKHRVSEAHLPCTVS